MPGEDGNTGGTPAEKTFTQADLDRIVQREKAQERAAADRATQELLGLTPAEAKARLDKAAADEAAALSEADRKLREATEREQKAAAREAAAELATRDTLAERALVRAGFQVPADDDKGETIAYGVRLLAGLPATADEATIVAEVASLKTRLPGLFTAAGVPAGEGQQTGGFRLGGGQPSSDSAPPARPGVPESDWGAGGIAEAQRRGIIPKTPAAAT